MEISINSTGIEISPGHALLKSLENGKTLSIVFKSLEKQDITIPISLSGFKEAYQKLL